MNFNQQQNSLPFDHLQLMAQPMQYNNDSPPCVPGNIQIVPQFRHLLVPVCALVANAVSSSYGNHAGRMFLFNQLSFNNYNNNDFAQVVSTVFDLLLLGVAKNNYRNPEDGVMDCVTKGLSLFASLNFQRFPLLQQVVPQEVLNGAATNLQTLQAIANEVQSVKQNISMQGQSNFGAAAQMPQQNNFFATRGQQVNAQQINRAIGNGGNDLFTNVQTSNTTGGSANFDKRFGYIDKQYEETRIKALRDTAVFQALENTPVFQSKAVVDVQEPELLVWRSSKQQPYIITVNPFVHRIGLQKVGDDVISYPVVLTEKEMEKALHSTSTATRAAIANFPEKYHSRSIMVDDSFSAIINSVKPDQMVAATAEEQESVKMVWCPDIILDNFIEPAIFSGRIKKEREAMINPFANCAYVVDMAIASPVIDALDNSEFLYRLSKCRTYARIVDVLKTGLADPDTVKISYVLDRMFTKEINNILRNRVSVKTKISSFIDDAVELVEHLEQYTGITTAKCYLSLQENFASTFCDQTIIDDSWKEHFYSNLGLSDESNLPLNPIPINYLTQQFIVAYLDIDKFDMAINPHEEYGSAVMRSSNPQLYDMVHALFEKAKNKEIPVAHVLLVTADNTIYEFNKGLLGNDFYTVCYYANSFK